jgi:DNA-binding XRE family transcriptional regulator
VSQSHDEVLDRWYRSRDEDRLRAFARAHASRRIHAVALICRNVALQKVGLSGLRELSEEEQDRHDQRFLEGKYAPKSTHVNISSFYSGAHSEHVASDPASTQVELRRRLWGMSSGEHILALRKALGWTQEQAAAELRISRRSVIRHEQGQHLRPRMRKSLLKRLCELESDYAEQLAAHLAL